MKKHDLNRVIVSGNEYLFFYQREKNDRNGNARFRVFIIDPDGPAVHETIVHSCQRLIADCVAWHIENKIGVNVPF